jgi:hypothetical protein
MPDALSDIVPDFPPRRAIAVKPPDGGSAASLRPLRGDGAVSTRQLAVMSFADPNRPSRAGRFSKAHGCKTPDPRTAVKAAQRPRSGLGLDGEHGSGPSANRSAKRRPSPFKPCVCAFPVTPVSGLDPKGANLERSSDVTPAKAAFSA